MTNPDRCREEFEKWCISKRLPFSKLIIFGKYDNDNLGIAWEACQYFTQATARRCVELCELEVKEGQGDEKDGALACCAAIATEFGLEGK